MVGSTATILAGTNSSGSSETVSMAWRTQTQAERTSPSLISDIVRSERHDVQRQQRADQSVRVADDLQPGLLPAVQEAKGCGRPTSGFTWRGWTRTTDKWENAIHGNYRQQHRTVSISGLGPTGDTTLGDWGVNTANHTVWAVVNYNGEFAAVPEPPPSSCSASPPSDCSVGHGGVRKRA